MTASGKYEACIEQGKIGHSTITILVDSNLIVLSMELQQTNAWSFEVKAFNYISGSDKILLTCWNSNDIIVMDCLTSTRQLIAVSEYAPGSSVELV